MATIQLISYVKNILSGYKNLLLRQTGGSLKPRWLVFMTTDRCNSRCIHCDIWQGEYTENPLTPEEIENVLSDPLFSNVEYILNTGGEPFIRDDIEEIVLAQHKILPKVKIQLSTNGLLPQRVISVVKTAMKNNIHIDLGTSIDGIGESHDKIRGVKGNFEKIDSMLQELIPIRDRYREKFTIGAQITLSDSNVDELEHVRKYTKELGIELLEGWYNESSFYDNIGKNKNSASLVEAVKSQPSSFIQNMWLRKLEGKSIKFPCFAAYTFCVLKCNGDIVPCLNHWDAAIGNVRENTPSEIWQSKKAGKVRKIVRTCDGCLNSWGTGWSFRSYPITTLPFRIKKRLGLYQ